MNAKNHRTRLTLVILAILAISYIGVQTFIAHQYADLSEQTEKRFKAIKASSIDERKKIEEAIALGIENSRKKLFWATFVTNISATIGVLVAFTSIWIGFRQYIQTQEKQQLERSKERHDRIAMELNSLWQGITSKNTTKRAGCAAGLQDMLAPDKAEFHRRVASALALLGRMPPAYHFVKNLSRKGVDLTIMVPWIDTPISRSIFGNEIKFVPVGIRLPLKAVGVYNEPAPDAHSQYGPPAPSVYGGDAGSAYGYAYSASQADIVNQFTRRALDCVKNKQLEFDMVHSHDWLTFKAAAAIADHFQIPWIAHFHSIEAERRKKPARWISRVEADAVEQADALVAPSKVTCRHIMERYQPTSDRIQAVPNCLSEKRNAVGRVVSLDPGLVVFVGRRSWQKGPDHFIRIARAIQQLRPQTRFAMYGRDDRYSPFLYGAYSANQRPEETNLSGLIQKTRTQERPLYLGPMDAEEIKVYRKMIRSIQPSRIDDLLIPRPLDALSKDDAEAAKTGLLQSGAILLPFHSSQNEYTHLASLEDADDMSESERVFLIDAASLTGIAQVDDKEHIALKDFIPWQRRYETFRDAAVLVVPSRFEPFGMNVLEAMQAGVAVFVAAQAGVNEVVKSIQVFDPAQTVAAAKRIVALLRDQRIWYRQVQAQQAEIVDYHKRGYEDRLLDLWQQLAVSAPAS
jgi:glycosyltransferase involved in cell wall biosynthesis